MKYLKKEKVYTKDNLTIKQISQDLSIPQHHISQVINEKLKTSYYTLINTLRVNEAKNLMMESVNFDKSLLEILLMAGFKSKSVFNQAFKEITGMQPREYRKIIKRSIK